MPMKERNTWFFAATRRNSLRSPYSLREAGRRNRVSNRMPFGTTTLTISSSDLKPHIASISTVSSAVGPMWRWINRSVHGKGLGSRAETKGAGLFTGFGLGHGWQKRSHVKNRRAKVRSAKPQATQISGRREEKVCAKPGPALLAPQNPCGTPESAGLFHREDSGRSEEKVSAPSSP